MEKFIIEATVFGRLMKITSDGTESGTKFEGDASDTLTIQGIIKRGESVPLGRDGVLVKADYSQLGLVAALLDTHPGSVRLTKVPREAQEFFNPVSKDSLVEKMKKMGGFLR